MACDPEALGARCQACPLGPNGALRKHEPWAPVPSEHRPVKIAALAESPGPDEVRRGYPFAGQSGLIWAEVLASLGKRRPDIAIVNTILCKPEGEKASGLWGKMEAELQRLNKRRREAGLSQIPHPVECCKPRLLRELEPYEAVITLGKTAYHTLTGDPAGIFKVRGSFLGIYEDGTVYEPLIGHHDVGDAWWKVYPTFHPAFITRALGFKHLWQLDLAKSFRWFSGAIEWHGVEMLRHPSPKMLRAWYRGQRHKGRIIVDTETDMKRDGVELTARTNYLRTICFAFRGGKPGGKPRVAGTWFISDDGHTRKWTMDEESEFFDVFQEILEDPDVVKIAHNMNFDQQVLERIGGTGKLLTWPCGPILPGWDVPERACRVEPSEDSLGLARAWMPGGPKGLKFLGTVLTDIGHWESDDKGESHVKKQGNDEPRLDYCSIDVGVLEDLETKLLVDAKDAGYLSPLPEEHKFPGWTGEWTLRAVDKFSRRVALQLSQGGVYIDQARNRELQQLYEGVVARRKAHVKDLAKRAGVTWDDGFTAVDEADELGDDGSDSADTKEGTREFNPGSYDQLRTLLYDDWDLGIPEGMTAREFLTPTGLPGTHDEVLRAHIVSGNLPPLQQEFLENLRLLRREESKILGTILYRMSTPQMHPKGRCESDGRARGDWGWHVTPMGRFNVRRVPLQVIGNKKGQGALKSIFVAAPGHVFIGGDVDQAHLRIIGQKWGIQALLNAFRLGWDPHGQTALGLSSLDYYSAGGPAVWPKGYDPRFKPESGKPLDLRNTSKIWIFAIAYAAGLNLSSDGSWDFDPSVIWNALVATENVKEVFDDNGRLISFKSELPYATERLPDGSLKWTKAMVSWLFKTFMKNQPEWIPAWLKAESDYAKKGYGETYLFGRRNNALSKLTERANFPVLGTEMELVRRIEWGLDQLVPFGSQGHGTGLVYNGHDSFVVECKGEMVQIGVDAKGKPKYELKGPARDVFEEAKSIANYTPSGWEVSVTSELRFGRDLKSVT